MSKSVQDVYGEYVSATDNFTEMSGRYAVQEHAEKRIVLDIVQKLCLMPQDNLLEIGCGAGNLLIPISFFVDKAVGIDHPKIINRLHSRYCANKLTLIGGTFPDVEISTEFDKILIYGVVLFMKNEESLLAFLDKALSLLSKNGRMLIGDITCTGRKERFLSSQLGVRFLKQWKKEREANPGSNLPRSDASFMEFTDEDVMKILLHARKKGFHSYLLEQPSNLPFGNSREDILIVGPEYEERD